MIDGIDRGAWTRHAVLSVAEMAEADRAAIAGGIAGSTLMEAAGAAVARAVLALGGHGAIAVLCGPGNNGGDGFVVARHLVAAGREVRLFLLGAREALRGDAAHHASLWTGPVEPLDAFDPASFALAVDALFGAGLARPPDGVAAQVLAALDGLEVVAVDLPSGLDGNTGHPLGPVARARATVTFQHLKPGHLLFPGQDLCGRLIVADIGIPSQVIDALSPRTARNDPDLWRASFPWPGWASHKYSRGHALVLGGAAMTGASRLAARAAQRAGAGYVTLAAPDDAKTVYRVALESIVVQSFRDTAGFRDLVEGHSPDAVVLGPGAGLTPALREKVLCALKTGTAAVVDADALAVFEDGWEMLASAIQGPAVLTPHPGEFRRLFPDLDDLARTDKLAATREAARRLGAVVVLKGADTVIAEPGGHAVLACDGPPDLAMAGSGDVLAGLIGGLLAGGMPAFAAACAACWLHAGAARGLGPGLIPEDIVAAIPGMLGSLRAMPS